MSSNVLLITGLPGIGKTTVITKVFSSLPEINISGFYTREIRSRNVRQGFELVTFEGDRSVMAHVESDSPYRVGKYGVNVEAVDRVAAEIMAENHRTELFIID
ncbi:MAG: hypothetical protein JRF02_06095 [Deltaproteobacteria bacterium]|jgi:nucleoside-triphosphatase|nr:hypothetical protein [Deltaproteobacteria bacterium]